MTAAEKEKRGNTEMTVEETYKEWLRGMYKDSVNSLAELVSDSDSSTTVQVRDRLFFPMM